MKDFTHSELLLLKRKLENLKEEPDYRSYTRDFLDLLKSVKYDWFTFRIAVNYDPGAALMREIIFIMEKELEEIPLYINHNHKIFGETVLKWRLEIGH